MAEAAVVKSNNGSKKRKGDGVGGNKSKKSLVLTSTSKISDSVEDSLSTLLMSNAPPSEYIEPQSALTSNIEAPAPFIKRTFHLGAKKYVIYQGDQGIIQNIYLKEWEDGEVKNQGIRLSVSKLVVILHYVEFIMSAIQKISKGNKEVDSSYYLGSGLYVSCAFPYRNVSIRLWKTANGKKYPTAQGMSFKFNEWDEFIKVAQKMYSEYSEIYTCEPCILDEDRVGHDVNSCEECRTSPENLCRGEVNVNIPI